MGYKHFSKTKPMRSEHCQPIRDWWTNLDQKIDKTLAEIQQMLGIEINKETL